jgi:hypothetical protein
LIPYQNLNIVKKNAGEIFSVFCVLCGKIDWLNPE